MSIASHPMTTEELLALPENGYFRELFRGELRKKPRTTRGGPHCIAMTNLSWLLGNWVLTRPLPRGRLYTSDARVRLRRDPDTFVDADLVYHSPEQAAQTDPRATYIDGPPILAIEILSPSDTIEDITDKVREYLTAEVALVWEVNPFNQTITIYRPSSPPESFNVGHDLTAEPDLPGFRVAVVEIFKV